MLACQEALFGSFAAEGRAVDFEERFLESATKKQKAAFQEIKRAAPKEWAEFKRICRESEAFRGQERDFMTPLFMLAWQIVGKAPKAAAKLQTLKPPAAGRLPRRQKNDRGHLKAGRPFGKEGSAESQSGRPKYMGAV